MKDNVAVAVPLAPCGLRISSQTGRRKPEQPVGLLAPRAQRFFTFDLVAAASGRGAME